MAAVGDAEASRRAAAAEEESNGSGSESDGSSTSSSSAFGLGSAKARAKGKASGRRVSAHAVPKYVSRKAGERPAEKEPQGASKVPAKQVPVEVDAGAASSAGEVDITKRVNVRRR